jgi:hypothetical protein
MESRNQKYPEVPQPHSTTMGSSCTSSASDSEPDSTANPARKKRVSRTWRLEIGDDAEVAMLHKGVGRRKMKLPKQKQY